VLCFEVVADVTIDFNGYTTTGDKVMDPSAPSFRESFHSYNLLKKRTLAFVWFVCGSFAITLGEYGLRFLL
jgi:hypothetical protein